MNCLNDVIQNYETAIKCLSSKALESSIINRAKIDAVFAMLSDEESKYTFGQEIQFCIMANFISMELATTISGNMSSAKLFEYVAKARKMPFFQNIVVPENISFQETKHLCCATTFLLEQYRYKNFVKVNPGDVCIDAGACFGDTALYFIQQGAQSVHSFEIDRSNIACLKQTYKNYNVEDKTIICNEALSRSIGETWYTPDSKNAGAGKIGSHKNYSSYAVKMTTIDAYCQEHNIHPDFIKMDIEGAELDALWGARETLLRDRPRCAICIYHSWPHRWEIPLFFRDLMPDCRFYLKKSQPFTETVFFVLPQ